MSVRPPAPSTLMWAIILRIWPDEPIFHLPGPYNYTKCGRAIHPHTPWLPMKHVKKFARLCRSCESA